MTPDDTRSFHTGPRMINPAFGIVLTVACLLLAAAQIWIVAGHISGSRSLAAHEPAARAVFAAVFITAGFGIVVAVLEQRNGRVHIDDHGLTVCRWTGCRTRLQWNSVASIGYLCTDADEAGIPFHWLSLTTRDDRSVRLAGGPWPASQRVDLLRHELVDRLNLEEQKTDITRWALIFPAQRTEWS
jgi:hypothetical protein